MNFIRYNWEQVRRRNGLSLSRCWAERRTDARSGQGRS